MIAARPTLDERRAYLYSVECKRGKEAAERLKTTMGLIWKQRHQKDTNA